MSSYLKFICPMETADGYIKLFYKDTFNTYLNLNLYSQIKFLLGQAISLNYLERVYNHTLPSFIADLKNELINKYIPDSVSDYNSERILNMVCYLLGTVSAEEMNVFSASELMNMMKSDSVNNIPVPCTQVFYESYLNFLEIEFCMKKGKVHPGRYHNPGLQALPQFSYTNSMLVEHDVIISEGYNYSYEDNRDFGTNPLSLGMTSIFAFWRGYNWRRLSFDSVVSILATYGELAVEHTSEDSMMRAYYDVYLLMNPMSTSANAHSSRCTEQLVYFLMDICNRFNIRPVDKVFLQSLCNTEEMRVRVQALQDDVVSTVNVAEANEALRSTLRNLGLDNKSSGSLPMFVEDANLVSRLLDAGNVKEEDQKKDQDDPGEDNQKDSQKKKDPEDPETTDEKTEDQKEETPNENQEAQPADDPNTTDDRKEEEPTQNEEAPLDQENTQTEEEQPASVTTDPNEDITTQENTDAETVEGEDNNNNKSSHTQIVPPKPKVPGMNLKRGVKLELADDFETIDSFLYRKEVGSFIDDVLSNPNHSLSVQQIAAFKSIKAKVLWTLNVVSLYHLLKEIANA